MSNKSLKPLLITLIVLALALSIGILIIIANIIGSTKEAKEPQKPAVEAPLPQDETSEDMAEDEASYQESAEQEFAEQGDSQEAPKEEPVSYPEPTFQFVTEPDTIQVQIEGLSRTYKIAWVSDLHLVADSEASEDIAEESVEEILKRKEEFKAHDGTTTDKLLPQIIDYLNYNDFDAIIFGGDLMDYCSKANVELLQKELGRLKYEESQILYIRADHDYGYWYGNDSVTEEGQHEVHALALEGKSEYDPDLEYQKVLEFDEFRILGINNSTKNLSNDHKEWLESKMTGDKPVLLATHVPFEPTKNPDKVELEALSKIIRDKIYYWSADGVDYIPTDTTESFLKEVYREDTPLAVVLAGHLHYGWQGNLTENLPQHIFFPAYTGCIGTIEVTP